MPLGAQVGLVPSHIVLDGNPAPPKKAQPPPFGPFLLWPYGWMDQDATWYQGRRRPGQHCVKCGSSSTPRVTAPSPSFRPMSVVAKRMPLGTKVGLDPGHIVLHGPSAPPKKRGAQPRSFRPLSIVAERSPISATAKHLYSLFIC